VSPKPPDPGEIREAAWWSDMSAGAKFGAGLVVVAIAVAVILAVALPRARRRRWAAGRRDPLPDSPGRTETPDQVFLFPAGRKP
jgi:membrane-anchored mycosin MYCP